MFSGGTTSEYDDIVNKTTDENLTSENWELILNLCDKVQDEGQTGAHAVIAAILKRLAHRNPNVQLYALSLAEALSKNLDIVVHREIASKAFTQGLEKLITDRNTHEKVRRRALGLVATWTADFEEDTSLGIMEDCYKNLKAKNYNLEQPSETAPPSVDDEIRRKEEEELQRVLEMSMQDRGGRPQWSQYSLAPASSSNPTSGSATGPSTSSAAPFAQPKYPGGGYAPARTPSLVVAAPHQQRPQTEQQPQLHNHTSSIPSTSAPSSSAAPAAAVTTSTTATIATSAASPSATSGSAMTENVNIVTRVRALHTFEPTEAGELAFEKGDIIKVVDRGYKDWWRGQLKGRTGIFPVNYVEAMPEPSASELAKEAEQEAAVFAQAMNVEKLLNMLRALDPAKDNLADNEEIQELYRSSMALRPKIVKLIDKYSQKRADLVSMNETFVRARTIFDRMMEESLARHTGIYDQPYHPSQYPQGRPDAGRRQDYQSSPRVPQAYGWKPTVFEQPAGYGAYPGPANAYPGQTNQDPAGVHVPVPYGITSPGPSGLGPQQQQPQGYSDPNVNSPYGPVSAPPPSTTAIPHQQHSQAAYGAVGQGGYGHQPNVPYSQQGPIPYPTQQQPVQQQLQHQESISQQPTQTPAVQQQPIQTPATQPQPIQQPQVVQPQPVQHSTQPQSILQHIQAQPVQQPVQQPTQVQPQPAQQASFAQHGVEHEQQHQQLPIQAQPETVQAQSHPQTRVQGASVTSSVSPQRRAQAQPQQQQQQPTAGPPYIYDPKTTYADPNVQAWAQYYAQGGRDLAGSVYFISIPGLTDNHVPGGTQQTEAQHAQHARQGQQQQQSANGTSDHRSLEGFNTSVQQQQQQSQSYQPQSQSKPSETDLPYAGAAAATTHHEQEQPPQLHESQFTQQLSQYQQPQHVQDQILTPPLSQESLDDFDYPIPNPYLQQQQQQSSVADVGFKTGIPARSASFGLGRGGRLSSDSIIGGVQPAASATPSWVLPKKTPPATVTGGSPIPAQSGLPAHLRRLSLSGPGAVEGTGRGGY